MRFMMDYNKIDVDKIVDEVYTAEAEGKTRPMTKQEIMRIRLAALRAIVRNMQEIVEKDHELVSASYTEGVKYDSNC
jgi:hypothetical protein